MGRKRSQKEIQERLAKRRKDADALLETGLFQTEDVEVDDRMPSKSSWDDDEQDYELKPRTLKGQDDEDAVEGLPIKRNGKVERNMIKSQRNDVRKSKEDEADNESNDEEENSKDGAASSGEEEDDNEVPDTEETIIELKETIAELVERIMEEAEENTAALTRLRKMAGSKNPNTAKFSILALVTVFKSIIPGYRIRPLTELEKKEKVTKEVARLRNFEENLVLNYKAYVDLLARLSRTPNNDTPINVNLGNIATNAAIELTSSSMHFNFRSELLTILIRRISKPNPSIDPFYHKAIKTIEGILNEDEEGNVSVEVIRLLSKVLKTRNYNVDESVINVLLSLDVLHDYDPNTKTEEEFKMKLRKKDRVHLSKKEKKARKERKLIEEEMRAAEQAVSAEERERNQAEILKLTLALYLNILRSDITKLVGSVLEGLAKFGHMANFDLLGDFLVVMKELIANAELDNLSSSEVRKVLLCIVTAFSLVSNHTHMKLSMDLSSFVDALFTVLPYLSFDADIEFSHKSLRLADPLNNELVKPSVNVSTKAELLLKALDHVFFRSKSGTKQRAAAFTKRIYMALLHTPEKTSIALLKFLDKLTTKYPEVLGLYSTDDRIGNGEFRIDTDLPSRSNAEAATIWENSLLVKHYSPSVVKGVRSLFHKSQEHK
ncbi:Noc3 [Kluyveromyces lactis]|nr:Noc3 [Kluyveromyces lactis]